MQDDQELQEERTVRANAMWGGIIAALAGAVFVVAVAMWYDGRFSETSTTSAPSNTAASQSAPAPSAPAPSGS
jgi:hypothetical protein